MKALIIGAGMANKGAELMLRTLVSEMRRRHPEIELGISPAAHRVELAADLKLARLALPLPHVASRAFRPVFATRAMVPGYARRSTWGWKAVDLILDISGFSYSDQWGLRPARNLARLAMDTSMRGGHVVLLPQAFGPFDKPGHATIMREALQHTSLVFARDPASHRYLSDLDPDHEIHLAPDLTIPFGVRQLPESDWVAVVPNVRMLDQGAPAWGDSYVGILAQQIRKLLSRGLAVRLVVHDDEGDDEALARRLMDGLHDRVELMATRDPLELKREFASARFVIGSRFHAITSSLACGVPVVVLGWSHKYVEMMNRYGLGALCFLEPTPRIGATVDALLDGGYRSHLRETISNINEEMAEDARRMWEVLRRFVHNIRNSPADV